MDKLYTTPYGSRLYGTFDEKSDWDWKTIFLPDIKDVLVGSPIKNIFSSTGSDTYKNTSEDTDNELVPIQVFCKDFIAGQSYALEIAFGALQHQNIPGTKVYDVRFLGIVHHLINRFLTANVNAMVGYAYHQSQLYSEKGNRLDKLHQFDALLLWAVNKDMVDSTSKLNIIIDYVDANEALLRTEGVLDNMLYTMTTTDTNKVESKNFSLLEKVYPGSITIGEAFQRVKTTINKYGKRANQAMINEGKDWKAISHAVRITQHALSILNTHYITLPLVDSNAKQLKDIKHGLVDWEVVQEVLISNIDAITASQLNTSLPTLTPELKQEFDIWLKNTIYNLYME